MTSRKVADRDITKAILKAALGYPGTEQGIACKGTAIESTTVTIRKKAFLFVRASEARLKLQESKREAATLASKNPGGYEIGANGWARIKFTDVSAPSLDLLEKWVGESFRVVGGAEPAAKLAKDGARSRTGKLKRSTK